MGGSRKMGQFLVRSWMLLSWKFLRGVAKISNWYFFTQNSIIPLDTLPVALSWPSCNGEFSYLLPSLALALTNSFRTGFLSYSTLYVLNLAWCLAHCEPLGRYLLTTWVSFIKRICTTGKKKVIIEGEIKSLWLKSIGQYKA